MNSDSNSRYASRILSRALPPPSVGIGVAPLNSFFQAAALGVHLVVAFSGGHYRRLDRLEPGLQLLGLDRVDQPLA